MYQVIRNYLEQPESARTPEQLRDAVSAVIAPIDLFAFAFLAQPNGGKPLLISTYPPDWTDHYIAQGYQCRDPVILHSRRVFDLFTWNPHMAKKFGAGARDFFHEAEIFNIRCGVTIPIHDWPGGHAAMTFASDRRTLQNACLSCNALALLFIALQQSPPSNARTRSAD